MPTQGLVNPIRKLVIPTHEGKRNAGTHALFAKPTPITVRSIPWKIQQF